MSETPVWRAERPPAARLKRRTARIAAPSTTENPNFAGTAASYWHYKQLVLLRNPD
jgi:hypothetical protein